MWGREKMESTARILSFPESHIVEFPVKKEENRSRVYYSSAAVSNAVSQYTAGTKEFVEAPQPVKRAAEAIKSKEDIDKIVSYLKSNRRYRDLCIFVTGINFGLRASDLLRLRIGDVLDLENGMAQYKDVITLYEQKTSKVQDNGQRKYRYRNCYMNDAVAEVLDLYLTERAELAGGSLDLNDFLFISNSRNSIGKAAPLTRYGLETILKRIVNVECGIDVRASTHMLRKTFAYHILMNAPANSDAVSFLMKVTGHSSRDSVMAYIGVTEDEVRNVCRGICLGK